MSLAREASIFLVTNYCISIAPLLEAYESLFFWRGIKSSLEVDSILAICACSSKLTPTLFIKICTKPIDTIIKNSNIVIKFFCSFLNMFLRLKLVIDLLNIYLLRIV